MKPFFINVFLLSFLLLAACEKAVESQQYEPPKIGFYHWQQRLNADSLPQHLLSTGEPLYTKCFDVSWSAGAPKALAVLDIDSSQIKPELIPVVFITNAVMKHSSQAQLEQLSTDLLSLVNAILLDYRSSNVGKKALYPALQIDCDWTISSRDNYFHFLQLLRKQLDEDVVLSSTIRLHQYRDSDAQGIPPVDRGTLMAYNVGDLNSWATINSQLDSNITASYLKRKSKKSYPLPLDIALPYYEWAAIYRNNELAYLINELTATQLTDSSRFEQLSTTRFQVKKSTYLDGYYLYSNDLIRLEGPDSTTLQTVAKQLATVPGFPDQKLLFYRIGSSASRQANIKQFEALASLLRNPN